MYSSTHWLPASHSDHHPEFSKPTASLITEKAVSGDEGQEGER